VVVDSVGQPVSAIYDLGLFGAVAATDYGSATTFTAFTSTYDVKVLEEPPGPLCSSLNSLVTKEGMNIRHEEIDPGSELGRHDGSSVRCTNWQFLV
jgi:hypothetical protein